MVKKILFLVLGLIFIQPAFALVVNRGVSKGELDVLKNAYSVCSAKKVISSYSGPLYQVTRDSDGATMDVYPTYDGWADNPSLAKFSQSSFSNGQVQPDGSILLVTTCYDQTGNGNTLIQKNSVLNGIQFPHSLYLNTDGAHAVFEGDGAQSLWFGSPGMLALTNGATGASVVVVRQSLLNNTKTQNMVLVATGTGTQTNSVPRMALGPNSSVNGANAARGGRLDADATQFTPGLANDLNWHVEVAQWDWQNAILNHQIDLVTDNLVGFQTKGAVPSTNSTNVGVFGGLNFSGNYEGKLSLIAFTNTTNSEAEVAALQASLPSMEVSGSPIGQILDWGGQTPNQGPYTVVPGVLNYRVMQPLGGTPDPLQPSTLQYNHHTRIAIEPNSGKVCVAHSGGAVNETDSEEPIVECSSDGFANKTVTIASPMTAPFLSSGGTPPNGTRYDYPRQFIVYNGKLYLIIAHDAGVNSSLFATEIKGDGTAGPVFDLVPNDPFYLPYDCVSRLLCTTTQYPKPPYDAQLSPALYSNTIVYGKWGGLQSQIGYSSGVMTPGYDLSPWTGNGRSRFSAFQEPETVRLPNGWILRIWRKVSGYLQNWIFTSVSKDGGQTFSPYLKTNIPNEPTSPAMIVLSNGHLAIISNPIDQAGRARDPLFISLYDTSQLPNVMPNIATYAINQVDVNAFATSLTNVGTTATLTVGNGKDTLNYHVGDDVIISGATNSSVYNSSSSPSAYNANTQTTTYTNKYGFTITNKTPTTLTFNLPSDPGTTSAAGQIIYFKNSFTPYWVGVAKTGGGTYAGAWENNGLLYISYSWHGKEQIWYSTVPVANL